MERVKSGIRGFDELVGGGIPRNSTVLLSGSAGCGKSVFGLEFIYRGAVDYKEPGMFISLEERREDIIENALSFGWDFEMLEKSSLVRVVSYDMTDEHVVRLIDKIRRQITDFMPCRLVLDSLSVLTVYAEAVAGIELMDMMGVKDPRHVPAGDAVVRRAVMRIINDIRSMKTTAILISELPTQSVWLSRDTVSEFMCDGVIKLERSWEAGEGMRFITVAKMRKTKMDTYPRPLEITENGIIIYEKEKVYQR
ncbi:MAG: ATPase domain-containing protein [Candidatus Micrarchaeia archaeon]